MCRVLQDATQEEIAGPWVRAYAGAVRRGRSREDDDEPFEEKMKRLTAALRDHFKQSRELTAVIEDSLASLGYEK